jgi:hypothetical protein
MDRHRRHVSTTKSMAENSSMLFTSHFLTQELVHAEEKHCPFFLTASSRGTRGGRRLQQRWQKTMMMTATTVMGWAEARRRRWWEVVAAHGQGM